MLSLQKMRTLGAPSLVLCACLMLSGCLTTKMYVDPALPTASKADLKQPAQPKPAQVLFEFRTKGNANAKATAEIRPRVVAVVAESALFSTISSTPDGADSGVLKIVIDNIVMTDNAAAKGFGTGLTLGLAGSMVSDGYVATATYSRDGKVTETTVKHAIHTTIGNHGGPDGLTALEPQAAVHQVMDQITWNALKQLDDQGAFD